MKNKKHSGKSKQNEKKHKLKKINLFFIFFNKKQFIY